MGDTATQTFQPLEWPFPGVLPNVHAQTVHSESSTSYLRSAHRQHQISLQKAQKQTKVARTLLDDAQLKLKRLRRERQGLRDHRGQLSRKTRPLEPEIEAIDTSILRTEMSDAFDVSSDLILPEGLTSEHQALYANLEREIQAVLSREGSLRESEAELSNLKNSIMDIRHCAIIADGSLGELDKVVRTVTQRLEEAVAVAGGSDALSPPASNGKDTLGPNLDKA